MKQLLSITICLIVLSCGSQNEKNKYPDGTCDCNELTGPVGGWRLNDKPYTGECISYYQNGNKESESEFLEGNINGHVISYYPDGIIEEDVEWKR